ncbi:MAG: PASTA domain-containing protein [Rikenellaceae bacterium]
MAKIDKEGTDWWQKPDHLKNGGRGVQPKPKSKAEKSTNTKAKGGKKKEVRLISKRHFSWIIGRNILIMLILGLGAAYGAHLLMQWTTRHNAQCTVPCFEGVLVNEAYSIAEANGLSLILNDSLYAPKFKRGEVLYQIPEAGSVVKPGRSIYVTINATLQKMVDLPYVAGRSLRQGRNMLEAAGFTIERLNYEQDIATNYILGQNCNGRDLTELSQLRVPVGTAITLTVGVNPDDNHTVVPSLVGKALFAARSALWDSGLNVGEITTDESIDPADYLLALVKTQSTPADSTLMFGDDISLSLTLSPEVVDRAIRAEIAERAWIKEMETMDEQIVSIFEPEVEVDSLEVEIVEERVIEKVVFEDLF